MEQVEKYLEFLRARVSQVEPKLPEKFTSLPDIPDQLAASYMFEVERRGRNYHRSSTTDDSLHNLYEWISSRSRGLILYGPLGTGKTTAIKALFSLAQSYYKWGEAIFSSSRAYYEKFADSTGNSEVINSYRRAKLLCLDDVGNEPDKCLLFGTPYQPIQDLLCYRYDAQKTTIISTNLDDEGLLQRYGPRLYDRFIETYDRILVSGENFRQNNR